MGGAHKHGDIDSLKAQTASCSYIFMHAHTHTYSLSHTQRHWAPRSTRESLGRPYTGLQQTARRQEHGAVMEGRGWSLMLGNDDPNQVGTGVRVTGLKHGQLSDKVYGAKEEQRSPGKGHH